MKDGVWAWAVIVGLACGTVVGSGQTPVAATDVSVQMPAGVATGYVQDPAVRRMNAVEVHYLKGWHFRGEMYLEGAAGGGFMQRGCAAMETGTYRVTSPDGLSFVELLPTATWEWETGPDARQDVSANCFPMKAETTAQEFLKRMAVMLRVQYAGDEAVPAEVLDRQKQQADEINANWAKQEGAKSLMRTVSGESARARVRFLNGTFAMEGRLSGQVICTVMVDHLVELMRKDKADAQKQQEAPMLHSCTASVTYLTAPESEYAGLIAEWDKPLPGFTGLGVEGMGQRPLAEWIAAYWAKQEEDLKGGLQSSFIRNEELLSWRGDVAHSTAVRKWIWRGFKVVAEANLDAALARAAEMAGSDHELAPDWEDAMLGGDAKNDMDEDENDLRPLKGVEWRNVADQKRFETHDAAADPNGILPGTWVKGMVQVSMPQ